MKIAIFGGSGFLGSHLVADLRQIGAVLNIDPSGASECFEDVECFWSTDIKDISDRIAGYDIVIYVAGASVPATSGSSLLIELETNLSPAIKAFQAIAAAGVGKTIYFSSGGMLYDLQGASPFEETSRIAPRSAYGFGKQACEAAIEFLHRTTRMDVIIVRPTNPYGPRQDPYGKQGVIPIWTRQILFDEEVVLYGENVSKDFLYVTDLVSSIRALILSNIRWGIFNIGSGFEARLVDVLTIIEYTLDKKAKVMLLNSRHIDSVQTSISCEHIFRSVGWTPVVSLEDGIRRTVDFVSYQLSL
jgi:UDP-glucose 4-epimerase